MVENEIIRIGVIVLTAVTYGWMEQLVFENGFGGSVIPGWAGKKVWYFTVGYHGPMAILCWLICWGMGCWWMFPSWMAVQDWFYYVFHPTETFENEYWFTAKLGMVFGYPVLYLGCYGLSGILRWLF